MSTEKKGTIPTNKQQVNLTADGHPGGAHHWNLQRSEYPSVSFATCVTVGCGATRYMPDDYEPEVVKLVKKLNEDLENKPELPKEETPTNKKGDSSARARHRYFESHKRAIITDLQTKGIAETIKIWHMSNSTVYDKRHGILARWGLSTVSLRAQDGPQETNGFKSLYEETKHRFDGYRQCVLDIFGSGHPPALRTRNLEKGEENDKDNRD